MDDIDRRLLSYAAKQLPLGARPFESISRELGRDPGEILIRLQGLKEQQIFRGFRVVFDREKLGFRRRWILFKPAPESSAEKTAEVLTARGGAVQSFVCDHEYHVWAHFQHYPHPGVRDSDWVKEFLGDGIQDYQEFPDLEPAGRKLVCKLNAGEIKVLEILQEEIPLTDEPYERLARQGGIDSETFLTYLKSLVERGIVKRITAKLTARNSVEKKYRWMFWQFPAEKLERLEQKISMLPGVLQCAKKVPAADFPYTLQVWAADQAAADVRRQIERLAGPWECREVAVLKQIDNDSPRFFVNRRMGTVLSGTYLKG